MTKITYICDSCGGTNIYLEEQGGPSRSIWNVDAQQWEADDYEPGEQSYECEDCGPEGVSSVAIDFPYSQYVRERVPAGMNPDHVEALTRFFLGKKTPSDDELSKAVEEAVKSIKEEDEDYGENFLDNLVESLGIKATEVAA